jgi:TonB family protein
MMYIELCEDNGGIILDLGEGGLRVTAAAALVANYYPHMRFHLPNSNHCVETGGQIIWVDDTKKQAGIQFADLTEGARSQIEDWISSDRGPDEIHDTLRPVRRKLVQLEMPTLRKTRVIVSEPAIAQGADGMRSLGDLFPSESASTLPPEVRAPAVDPMQSPIGNGHRDADLMLGLRWGTHTDRTDPTTTPRIWIRPTAFVGLVAIICFAMGMAIGNGPSHGLLLNIERLISRGGKSDVKIAASPSNSLARPSNSSLGDAPQQAPEASVEPSRVSSVPDHDALPDKSEEQPTGGNAPDVLRRRWTVAKSSTKTGASLTTILVNAPGEGSPPLVLTLPERAVSASPTFAISSQRSIIVRPEPDSDSFHRPKRLTVGEIIFYVEPQYPRIGGLEGLENTLKLSVTVDSDGYVSDVRAISGPRALFPQAMSAVRKWRYHPTFLNGQAIKTQENIMIVFRRS